MVGRGLIDSGAVVPKASAGGTHLDAKYASSVTREERRAVVAVVRIRNVGCTQDFEWPQTVRPGGGGGIPGKIVLLLVSYEEYSAGVLRIVGSPAVHTARVLVSRVADSIFL